MALGSGISVSMGVGGDRGGVGGGGAEQWEYCACK